MTLEFTNLVTSLPIELGSAFINLTGIPSTPEVFLLSRPFIIEITSDPTTSERWKVDEASEQNCLMEGTPQFLVIKQTILTHAILKDIFTLQTNQLANCKLL